MKRVYHSIFFSALDRYGSLIFFLISTAVLARLLSPAEFGIYAVVNALTTIIAISFQEFGGSNYLIQKPHLSEQHVRTAFTIILAMSATFAVLLFLLRNPIAYFFAQDGIGTGIGVACLNLLLSPFAVTSSALLRRELAFAPLARCNLVGSFITAAVSIELARRGYSYMAPVIGVVCGNAATAIGLLSLRRNWNIFRLSLLGYAEVLRFGAYSSGVVLVNVAYNLSPQLILARVLGFDAAGMYSRASSMTQVFDRLITQVMNPVIGPTLVAHSHDGGDLKKAYLQTIELITALQWPFLTFLALLAKPIILVWLGPNWSEVAPLIRMLCLASLSLFASCLTYPMLMTVGRVKDTLTASLISLPPSLALLMFASFFGIEAVAASAFLTMPLQAAVANYFVARQIRMAPMDLVNALLKSGLVTLCSVTGAATGLALSQYGQITPLAELGVAAILAGTAWVGGLLITGHPLLEHAMSLVNALRPNSQTAPNN
jgi:O-antigen/teichoic acid export membrane protein